MDKWKNVLFHCAANFVFLGAQLICKLLQKLKVKQYFIHKSRRINRKNRFNSTVQKYQNVGIGFIPIVINDNLIRNFAVFDLLQDIFLTNLDEALKELVKFHFYDRG